MKKISSLALLIFFVSLFALAASAEREAVYTFKEAVLTSSSLIPSNNPVANVNDIGFICQDDQCNSVAGSLRNGAVTSSGTSSSMLLSYPTDLQSIFGYGEYFYKEGYITWEQNPDFFGTDFSDPQGPFTVYLSKKDKCISPIDTLSVLNDVQPNVPLEIEVVADLDATVHAAMSNAGPLNFIPPSLADDFYSVETDVYINIFNEDGDLVHEDFETVLIPVSNSKRVYFTWVPTYSGKFSVVASTFVTDQKCLSSEKFTTAKLVNVLENSPASDSCYTLLQNLATDDQFPSEGETLQVTFSKISNHVDDDGELTPVPTKLDLFVVRTSDGLVVLRDTVALPPNHDVVNYQPFTFDWDIPNPGKGWYTILIKGKAKGQLCEGLEEFEEIATLDVFVDGRINEAPVIEGLPDINIEENLMPPDNLIDLWDFAFDDIKLDQDLTFRIVAQSNPDLITCSIDSNRFIDCGLPALDQHGHSDVTVEVSDGFFTDRDTFDVHIEEVFDDQDDDNDDDQEDCDDQNNNDQEDCDDDEDDDQDDDDDQNDDNEDNDDNQDDDNDNEDDDQNDDNNDDDQDDDNGGSGDSSSSGSSLVEISRVIYDERVKPGDYLHINVITKGSNQKNLKVKVWIPALNINEQFASLNNIEVLIPDNADAGLYALELKLVSNSKGIDEKYIQFYVDAKEAVREQYNLVSSQSYSSQESAKGIKNTPGKNNNDLDWLGANAATIVLVALSIVAVVVITSALVVKRR